MGKFEDETGIRPQDWKGKFWARWGDAVREAGFEAQELQKKWSADYIYPKLTEAFRHYSRPPTKDEFLLFRQVKPDFPWYSSLTNHFGTKSNMIEGLREWASEKGEFADIVAMLPKGAIAPTNPTSNSDGHVYLIKSGAFYKIGRGDELEKRVKQIRTALPDASTLEHSIRTDDPAGIEAYWHRRFADKRANGEWFKLSPQDVIAFKKRKFQ